MPSKPSKKAHKNYHIKIQIKINISKNPSFPISPMETLLSSDRLVHICHSDQIVTRKISRFMLPTHTSCLCYRYHLHCNFSFLLFVEFGISTYNYLHKCRIVSGLFSCSPQQPRSHNLKCNRNRTVDKRMQKMQNDCSSTRPSLQ